MKDLLARLHQARTVAIFTHQRPDPDALGSQAAAVRILRALGATKIHVLHFGEVPGPYKFLHAGLPAESALFSAAWGQEHGASLDTILIVDTCTYNQLEPAAPFLQAQRDKVVAVDHHLTRDDVGPLVYADTQAAACVEILWELSRAAGIAMNAELSLPLMAGLVADTGWFRFDSVTPRTHLMAADLTPHVDNSALYEKLMQTETRPKLGLMQRALAGVRWSAGDRFACMVLTQRDFAETGATQSQTEYLVDMAMIVGTVEVVALLTEMPDGKVRASLRSKHDVDVNAVCRGFGGGGHAKASGCRLAGPMEAAYRQIDGAVRVALGA